MLLKPRPSSDPLRAPWASRRRNRRLVLVALMFPGAAAAIAGTQILRRPELVILGLAWLVGGAVIWRWLMPRLVRPSQSGAASSLPPDPEEMTL